MATVDLATYLNLEDIISTALKLGITTGVKDEPSIILGAAEVRVLDMAAAYAATANGGYAVFPYAIREITDTDGYLLYQYRSPGRERVLKPETVRNINILLREVVVSGTGNGLEKLKTPAAKRERRKIIATPGLSGQMTDTRQRFGSATTTTVR